MKAKLQGRQCYEEEKEDIADANKTEITDEKTEISIEETKTIVENDEEEEREEDPINIAKEVGDNDKKVDKELPDDDFFDVQPNKSGKIQKAQKTMVETEEENPDEVIGDFFNKPMMAQKAQMKIKRKLAKISK